ncbi:hypothetical protein HD554DRAFT_2042764 [Boletus coccyginus]|nr:hypothetical protein HD554DRAFT_2042764 [Boletus coccyginus]
MSSSSQGVYAANLQQNRGYPLFNPEPSSGLRTPYNTEGFQIGDVGYVDNDGEFTCLFNICFPLPAELCQRGVPPFDPIPLENAFTRRPLALPEDHLFITGVERHIDGLNLRLAYKFTATSNTGAILILPSGATLSELRNEDKFERFREFAKEYAVPWCKFARRDSLYLVTGVYTARSWTLASFDKGLPGRGILVEQPHGETGAYKWTCAFQADCRPGPRDNRYENQTVLIKGFKMTVRLAGKLTVVEHVTGWQSTIVSFGAILLALLAKLLAMCPSWLPPIAMQLSNTIRAYPKLVQSFEPLHYSDLINRYLLDKNSEAQVAITHDNEWIDMLQKMLFIFKAKGSEDINSTHHKSDALQSTAVSDDVQIVITHIRAENVTVGLGRVPVGFYVQIECRGGTFRRTKNKAAPVYDRVIQWDDRIHLCGTLELPLFFNMDSVPALPCSSLLVAVQRWQCNYYLVPGSNQVDGTLDPGESSVPIEVMKETDAGHDALFRYQRDRQEENLASSVAHFERALSKCPDEHPCRAAALFNLAKVEIFTYQFHGTSHNFENSISHYREALNLRQRGHQDRPMTLLHLSQALLYRYGMGDEASTKELRELVDELMNACLEDTHERRAAALVLQTYERFRLRDSDDLAELKKLVSELDAAVQEPPDDYFDRPIRYNNLGFALQRRFQLCCDPNDLDQAIGWLEKATQTTSNNYPDKPDYLTNLGDALLVRFQLQHAVPLNKRL